MDKLWADWRYATLGSCPHRLCSKVLMRLRKSVGTVRRAAGRQMLV